MIPTGEEQKMGGSMFRHHAMRLFVLSAVLSAATGPLLAVESGLTARYVILGPGEKSQKLVTDLTLTILGSVASDGALYADWQMEVTFAGDKRLAVRAASERAPLSSPSGCGVFASYAVRMPDGSSLAYRDQRTGLAAMPLVAFRELFLPTMDPAGVLVDGFAASGRYLGHVIILDRVTSGHRIVPIEQAKLLTLRSDLVIGTSRNFKDDGKGRKTPKDNYAFVPFVESDYREMIEAGINYYIVDAQQLPFVRDEAVYYNGPDSWPEDYYRSNLQNYPMFSDEPMVRLAWQEVAPSELDHPQQIADFLKFRVRHIYSEPGMSGLDPIVKHLARSKIFTELSRWDWILSPTWETEYDAAFYELAGGAPGIVHEGRYVDDGQGWHPTQLFGPGLKWSSREMLACYYAFLRGAARAHAGHWGTSIYGQSDPALRVEAMTTAYDMGAKNLWFWTSDHDHHMEYPLQLQLTRDLLRHASQHPRRSLTELRCSARTAVVFPAGYTLSWGHMWGQRPFSFESRNRTGTPYREVVAAAMWEGLLCAKRGIAFDFTVEHEGLENLGYDHLIVIGENADVRSVPPRMARIAVQPRLGVSAEPPAELKAAVATDPPLTAIAVHDRAMTVDGRMDDWKGAGWITHRQRPSGGEKWDGPADLAMELAFAYDASNMYFAARIGDDRHNQPYDGWDMWKGDSIQIGFDPLNENAEPGYTPNQSEIGFVLTPDKGALAWRWHCRRGSAPREIPGAKVVILRDDANGLTSYEAAVPLVELAPLSPEITPVVGVGIVVNDADIESRETFHETSPGAMTAGKHPIRFRRLVMRPAAPEGKASVVAPRSWATLVWHETVAPVGGCFAFDVSSRSWDSGMISIEATLECLPPLNGASASSSIRFEQPDRAMRRRVNVKADAPPGRYRLGVVVTDRANAVLAHQHMTVFVYPPEQKAVGTAPR